MSSQNPQAETSRRPVATSPRPPSQPPPTWVVGGEGRRSSRELRSVTLAADGTIELVGACYVTRAEEGD
jgi:hypothetical protein